MFAIHQVNKLVTFQNFENVHNMIFWRQGNLIKITKQDTVLKPVSFGRMPAKILWGIWTYKDLEDKKGIRSEEKGNRQQTLPRGSSNGESIFWFVLSTQSMNIYCVCCKCYYYFYYDHYNNNVSLTDSSLLPMLPRETVLKNRIHPATLPGRDFKGTTHWDLLRNLDFVKHFVLYKIKVSTCHFSFDPDKLCEVGKADIFTAIFPMRLLKPKCG